MFKEIGQLNLNFENVNDIIKDKFIYFIYLTSAEGDISHKVAKFIYDYLP